MAAIKQEKLVIDPELGWEFSSEEELYDFFQKDIAYVEKHFAPMLKKSKEGSSASLEATLEDPDEIWYHPGFFKDGRPLNIYVKKTEPKTHLAFCHCFENDPVFIYHHAVVEPLESFSLVLSGRLIFDSLRKDVFKGAVEGDSLTEADPLAMGLYKAMVTLRSSNDISEDEFFDFSELREETIEEADEIWRHMDSYGNHLVTFIKEFEVAETEELFFYLSVTLEDEASDSHVLLFSFPTRDEHLVDRYRAGENLQAEEVVHEGSH